MVYLSKGTTTKQIRKGGNLLIMILHFLLHMQINIIATGFT